MSDNYYIKIQAKRTTKDNLGNPISKIITYRKQVSYEEFKKDYIRQCLELHFNLTQCDFNQNQVKEFINFISERMPDEKQQSIKRNKTN